MKKRLSSNIAILLLITITPTVVNMAAAHKSSRNPQIQRISDLVPGVTGPVAEESSFLPLPHFPEVSPLVWHSVWLNVPSYSQNDPGWKNDLMQNCGKTIGEAGCALTSTAMAFKYNGASKTPGQLNTCMGEYACPFYWNYGAAHCSDYRSTYVGKYGFSWGLLLHSLEDDHPPILKMVKSNREHWVVVNAVDGSGYSSDDYEIADPWDGRNESLSILYQRRMVLKLHRNIS